MSWVVRSGPGTIFDSTKLPLTVWFQAIYPPEPALDLSVLQGPLEKALLALGRVDGLSTLLPDTHLFLYRYVRKEALLSSQIEGTQSSLSDLLLFEMDEAPGVPLDDVVEVSNYVMALEHGLRRLREGFPLCNRLIREMHDEYYALLNDVRQTGDWESWLAFFLDGVAQTGEEAVSTAQRLLSLFQEDHARIQPTGRAAGSALRVHLTLQERPIVSLQKLVDRTNLSFPAVSAGMKVLENLGVAQELTGRKRNRLFGYGRYIAILGEGTEPL